MKKTIKVVAAIILNDKGEVFSAKRDYGFLKGKWEFPGGKIKEGETDEDALKREIKEELLTDIEVNRFYRNVKYEYPDFHLDRNCYLCKIKNGWLTTILGIHSEEAFHSLKDLKEEDWCPADQLIVNKILQEGTLF